MLLGGGLLFLDGDGLLGRRGRLGTWRTETFGEIEGRFFGDREEILRGI
jgi:hypothetical protein